MNRRPCSLALPLALTGGLAACAPDERADPAAQPLLGGSITTAAPPSVGDLGFCTGALVDPRFVLTAGHCLDGSGPLVATMVYANGAATAMTDQAWQLWNPYSSVIPNFYENDVALLRTTRPALGGIPARLAPRFPPAGTTCTKYGAGCQNRTTEAGPGVMQQFTFPWPNSNVNCPGDSGGPVFCDDAIVAVNSGYTGIGDTSGEAGRAAPILRAARPLGGTALALAPSATLTAWSASPGSRTLAGDFNADGRTDLALIVGTSSVIVAFNLAGAPGNWGVTNAVNIPGFAAWSAQARGAVVGDFDGDRRADIALYGGPGWQSVPVAFSNGNGTFRVTNVTQPGGVAAFAGQPGAAVVAADRNADGADDLIVTGAQGWTSIVVGTSTGAGAFTTALRPAASFSQLAAAGSVPVAGDFNGDGYPDVALLPTQNGWSGIPVAYTVPDGSFSVSIHPAPGLAAAAPFVGGRVVAGDFDRDGDDDLALAGVQGWTTALFGLSNRAGFDDAVLPMPVFPALAQQSRGMLAGDFDGDGREDLALYGANGWGAFPLALVRPGVPSVATGEVRVGDFGPGDALENGRYVEDYYYTANSNDPVTVALVRAPADAEDTLVRVIDTATWNTVGVFDDDPPFVRDARGFFPTVRGRTYILRATTYGPGAAGGYRLALASRVSTLQEDYPGQLDATDGAGFAGRFAEAVVLLPNASRSATINLRSAAFDPVLEAVDPATGAVLATNDDCPSDGLNSCLTLAVSDRQPVVLRVTSYVPRATGAFTLRVN
ncbi:MAG: VCBS repeat-containing protein [Deltaproteobacteria bacterium]|nr:VCBS repeat-containing protein [Deltaproteobacteria bacterium]